MNKLKEINERLAQLEFKGEFTRGYLKQLVEEADLLRESFNKLLDNQNRHLNCVESLIREIEEMLIDEKP